MIKILYLIPIIAGIIVAEVTRRELLEKYEAEGESYDREKRDSAR